MKLIRVVAKGRAKPIWTYQLSTGKLPGEEGRMFLGWARKMDAENDIHLPEHQWNWKQFEALWVRWNSHKKESKIVPY